MSDVNNSIMALASVYGLSANLAAAAAADLRLRQQDATESRDRSQLDGEVDRCLSFGDARSVQCPSVGVQPRRRGSP